MDQILKPVDAKPHQVQVWWYVRNVGKPAEEYFNNELEDADRARISRTFEAIRKGQQVPETLFKGRRGKPKLFEFKSGKHRLLAFYLTLNPGQSGYVVVHGCCKAGGTSKDVRPADVKTAEQRMSDCLCRVNDLKTGQTIVKKKGGKLR